jgi:uncharacterized protein YggE
MKKVLFVFIIIGHFSLFAQEKKSPATINVKGISSVKLQPDEGILNLSTSFIGLDVNLALQGLDKKTKELMKQVIAAGLDEKEAKTINFQLNKNIVYRKNSSKDSGFVASHGLQVKFKYSKESLAKILNTFSQSKADYNLHFNFVISDSLKKQTEAFLMKLAVKDASNKANILAKEAGVSVKSIKSIEYGIIGQVPYYPMAKTRSMMAESSNDMGLEGFTPNDIELNDEVLIVWEIE